MGQTSEEYQDKDTMTQRAGPAITLIGRGSTVRRC